MSLGVLVVDDQPDVRLLMRIYLDEAPDLHVIGEASDGPDAIEQFDELGPDVVLMDAAMPTMSGYEVATRMRERSAGAALILCSAHIDDEVEVRARAAGFDGVLQKEDFEELAGRVRDIVASVGS